HIEGMEHRAHRRDGKVGLEVRLRVPAEGADAIAGAHAEARQPGGEPLRPLSHLAEAGAADVIALAGHHLAPAVDPLSVLEEGRDGEGALLHRATQHRAQSSSLPPEPTKRSFGSANRRLKVVRLP